MVTRGSRERFIKTKAASITGTMWQTRIHRAKPNPYGKDVSSRGVPKPEQLLGEWVDIKNVGDNAVSLATLHIANTQYGPTCVAHRRAIYWNGISGVLAPGEIVRVHTGKSSQIAYMRPDDWAGVQHHVYAERGSFVLNNQCGDRLYVLWYHDGKEYIDDEAWYEPNPAEGTILYRNEAVPVPTVPAAAYGAGVGR